MGSIPPVPWRAGQEKGWVKHKSPNIWSAANTASPFKSRASRQPANKAQREIAFSSIQDLQYYSELLHHAVTQLESNRETLVGLRSICASWQQDHDLMMQHQVSAYISQLSIDVKWVNGMLERIRQISNLVTHYPWPFQSHSNQFFTFEDDLIVPHQA